MRKQRGCKGGNPGSCLEEGLGKKAAEADYSGREGGVQRKKPQCHEAGARDQSLNEKENVKLSELEKQAGLQRCSERGSVRT